MIKIKTYLICALFLITGLISAQSNDELAKSYFLQAQEAYGNSKTKSAIQLLDQCVKTLGETNPKIEALYIKIKRDNLNIMYRHALETQVHLDTYLSMVTVDQSEYDEVLKLASSIKSMKVIYINILSKELAANKDRNWEASGPIYIDDMGYYNANGELAIDEYFRDANQFIDGYAIVVKYSEYNKRTYETLIDFNGKQFSSKGYSEIEREEKGLYRTEITSTKGDDFDGIINTETGIELTLSGFVSDRIYPFQENGIAIFSREKKINGETENFYGLINKQGEVIAQPIYREIKPFSNGLAWTRKEKRVNGEDKDVFEFIKSDGSLVPSNLPDGWLIGNYSDNGLVRITNNNVRDNKWGYRRGTDIVIKEQYDFAWDFSDGLAIVKSGEKYLVIDTKAKVLGEISEKFTFEDGYGLFKSGKAILENNNGFFVIDQTGKVITETLKCYDMEFVSENVLLVNARSTPYFVDLNFNKLNNIDIYSIGYFNEGVARIKIKEDYSYFYGYINKNGAVVIPPIYHDAEPFKDGKAIVYDKYYNETILKPLIKKYGGEQLVSEGLTVVYQEGKYGFIDQNDTMIIDLKFEDAWNFENGRARVKIDDKIGFIDKAGKMVIPAKFDKFTFDSTHNANIGTIDGKKGLYANDGTEIVPPIYDNIQSRSELGFTVTESKGLQGILDKDYTVLVTPKYDFVSISREYSDEFIAIKKNNLWGLLDFDGNEVFEPQFKYVSIFHSTHNLARAANSDDKYGFINKTGKIVIPLEYDRTTKFYDNGLAGIRLTKSGLWGFIDTKGNIIVQPKYDKIYKMEDNCSFIPVGYRDRKGDPYYTYISQKGELYDHKDNFDRVREECKGDYLMVYKGKRVYRIDSNGDRTKL